MKILFTSDLHVDQGHYQRLFELLENQSIDCLIIGGDIIPNKPGFHERVHNQRDYIKRFFHPYAYKLRETKPNLGVYLMMGNDDVAANMDLLEEMEKDGLLNLIHNKHHVLEEGLHLVGYGYVPITPFSLKDWERFDTRKKVVVERPRRSFLSTNEGMREIDIDEVLGKQRTIEDDMEDLSRMADPKRTIFVMHAAPYNTALDRLFDRTPCGSKSIRNFIERRQPYITLHGHIHESPQVTGRFMDEIGETISVNPGQETGLLHVVIFDTVDAKGTIQLINRA